MPMSPSGSSTVSPRRSAMSLADHCTGVVKLACSLESELTATAEQLGGRFHEAFAELESKAQRSGIAADAVRLAKYALCAWIDERILASDLSARSRWASEPLQLRYFDDFSAGEEFYIKLEAVRAAPELGEVLEVYGLCIALGFRGKLADERGLERRRLLVQQIASDLQRGRGVEATRGPTPEPVIVAQALSSGVLVWVAPLASVFAVVLAWIFVEAWVAGAVDALAASIGEVSHGS